MSDVIKTHQYENLGNQASYVNVMIIIMSLSDGVLCFTGQMNTLAGACCFMYSCVAISPLAHGTEVKERTDVT